MYRFFGYTCDVRCVVEVWIHTLVVLVRIRIHFSDTASCRTAHCGAGGLSPGCRYLVNAMPIPASQSTSLPCVGYLYLQRG